VLKYYQSKDFIETAEGLIFAVVEQGLEEGRVLCFLRYIKQGTSWLKVSTEQANLYLKKNAAQYLFFSKNKSASLHAVFIDDISVHHNPSHRLQAIFLQKSPDLIEHDCIALCQLFIQNGIPLESLGITGSLLIGMQKESSDIDIVIYEREIFHRVRKLIKEMITKGKLATLKEQNWLDSYQRRSCTLDYQSYVWHEQRKYNKALINNRKFDLNLIVATENSVENSVSYKKQGKVLIQAKVVGAQYAFDYPARFQIKHATIKEIVCYTATYTGQAEEGEWIEVSGTLEWASNGNQRILVGSTREAQGEYIKVISKEK
jgi:predicted nucleotidyltransferase